MLDAITKSPYFLYAKLALLGGIAIGLVALSTWATWTVRSSMAEDEKREAVSRAIGEIESALEAEMKLRLHYQALSDSKFDKLLKSISNIKVEHKTITNNITAERETYREFYVQPLPPGGYEQWKKAREMTKVPVEGSAQSSSLP